MIKKYRLYAHTHTETADGKKPLIFREIYFFLHVKYSTAVERKFVKMPFLSLNKWCYNGTLDDSLNAFK